MNPLFLFPQPPPLLTRADIYSLVFQSLPGADRLAKKTGAIIIANGEAITIMRAAGVPEAQLQPVAGGERIPLFTRAQRDAAAAAAGQSSSSSPPHAGGGPRLPPTPPPEAAVADVHVWPALHCLLPPGGHAALPEVLDTGTTYGAADDEGGSSSSGPGDRYACTIDITRAMTHGFGSLIELAATPEALPPQLPAEMRDLLPYLRDRERNRYSFYDGGQLLFNFLLGHGGEGRGEGRGEGKGRDAGPTLLWHGHLGCYEGIMKSITPRPDVAILAVAGRGNLDGRPFVGSAAEFATREVRWLGEPARVIWCLHDEAPIAPRRIDTAAATEMVERETGSRVVGLKHVEVYKLF